MGRIKVMAIKPKKIEMLKFDVHILSKMKEREISEEDTHGISYNSLVIFKQRLGEQYAYYFGEGFIDIPIDEEVRAVGWLDEKGETIIKEEKKILWIK